MNYLSELAARSQRRTKSSLIEAALVEALNVVPVDPRPTTDEVRPTISSTAELLWHVEEVERLWRLALYAPHLMTYDEQKIWAIISRNGYFFYGRWQFYGDNTGYFVPDYAPGKLILFRVEQLWELIKAVATGDQKLSVLPQAVYSFPWDDRMNESTMAPPLEKQPQTNGDAIG